jgi:hypothetical protein
MTGGYSDVKFFCSLLANDTSNVFKLAALQDSDTELIEELAGLSALDYARRPLLCPLCH